MKTDDQTIALPAGHAESVGAGTPALPGRRRFIRKGTLLAVSAAIGAHLPFGRFLPDGLIPVALAEGDAPGKDSLEAFGKRPDLIVLGDRPFVAETPAHLLDDDVTPVDKLFVRNNGLVPAPAADPDSWVLRIDGEAVRAPREFTLKELKSRFKAVTLQIGLECGGNGRAGFQPPAKGNQWTYGGVGFPEWTGVRLADVLREVGVTDKAVYIGYEGDDRHLSGDSTRPVISRGCPIAKAMEEETLLAWAMNGEPLRQVHGFPLRLVVGGVPGSVTGKWLKRIAVRDKVHDGTKMGGHDYRVACNPIAPGEQSDDYCILEKMPVKSLITFPQSGSQHPQGTEIEVRGQAWTAERGVRGVEVSYDFGQSWLPAKLGRPRNRFAPTRFRIALKLPKKGYYEIWARATDDNGLTQPIVAPGWNTGGYGNNQIHRIALRSI